jgi:fatty acid desaturase
VIEIFPVNTQEIVDLCKQHTIFSWSAQGGVAPLAIERAAGIYFWDTEGKRSIDFNSQLMCNNVGHNHTKVAEAIKAQADKRRAQRAWDVTVSNVGFFGAVGAIAASCWVWGAQAVAAYYFVPYLVTNLYLVLITYLQHTDEKVAHYRGAEFTWLRGALATVDRSYGWLMDELIHHIADTHVVHHMFHEMPFYHAREATLAVRGMLGDYYLSDHTPVPRALFRSFSQCRYIDNEGDIVYYKGVQEFNAGLKKGE